jgi:hypothetical protein
MADEQPVEWKKKYGPVLIQVAAYVITLLLGALAAYLGLPAPPPVVVERNVMVPVVDEFNSRGGPDPAYTTGWKDDEDGVSEIVKGIPIKVFADTPAYRGMVVEPDHVYLWEASKKVLGKHIPTRDQKSVGSCVAFGAAAAVEYLQVIQIASGTPGEFRDLVQEVIYGGSRVEVGGGRIRGDGSVGAWGAEWCQQWGVIARGKFGSLDLSEYNEARCREFGKTGVPDELEPIARERPVQSITQVKTIAEARAALANGYPITVASNVGFGNRSPYTRDAEGFLRASGTWAHQMVLIGYRTGARPGMYCLNSWGPDWVKGPPGPGEPPPGGFWIDDRTVLRMFNDGDSWAFGALVGFPARKLDWLIRAGPPRPRDIFTFAPRESSLAW